MSSAVYHQAIFYKPYSQTAEIFIDDEFLFHLLFYNNNNLLFLQQVTLQSCVCDLVFSIKHVQPLRIFTSVRAYRNFPELPHRGAITIIPL